MTLREWSKSEIDYGRKLVQSGLAGARSGRQNFLDGKTLDPFLADSLRHSWLPTAIGACIGLLASEPGKRGGSAGKVLGCTLLGGVIGFTAGMAWETRSLMRSVASGAASEVGKVRDEHWFETHPIDYA